jgi:dienelactone hydrolase
MATVFLFHSAQGLRPGVHAAADILRAAGHVVHTPDYYDGEVFDELDPGLAKRDALGYAEIEHRAFEAVKGVEEPLVFAGFSLGAAAAQLLAATHPWARGAVLLHGGAPVRGVTTGAWPTAVPVQVHYAADDPWIDDQEIKELRADVTAAGAACEVHVYPGATHLFADPDLPGYDPDSSALMWRRVVAFLSGVDKAN